MKRQKGFTLIETLIVLSIIGVVGLILADLLTRGFKGSAKTQLIGNIKQNGQVALNTIEQTVRNADTILCASSSRDVIALQLKDSSYVRFRLVPQVTSSPTINGLIAQDTLTVPSSPTSQAQLDNLCALSPDPSAPAVAKTQNLTDNNTTTGVSVLNVPGVTDIGFVKIEPTNTRSPVKVKFYLAPGISAGGGFENQIDPVLFETTIQLR